MMRNATEQEQDSIYNYTKSISNEMIVIDEKEVESVLSVRTDGKYCKITDKYLITITRL